MTEDLLNVMKQLDAHSQSPGEVWRKKSETLQGLLLKYPQHCNTGDFLFYLFALVNPVLRQLCPQIVW